MKKNYFRKVLMAVTMLLCSVAVSAYDFEVDNICYDVTSETDLTVEVAYKGTNNFAPSEYSGGCVIPEKVSYNGNSYSVTSIGYNAFYNCDGLTSITIPNSVTSIGERAFYGCSGLTSVTIPNSVTSIGLDAFSVCTGLTSVTIPNSVTSIGDYVFYYCTGLTSIVVESGNTVYDSRNNCNAIIETATNTLFQGCKNTIIPNSVTSIGEGAFMDCSGLTSVTIPNSVTSIGDGAFMDCSGLTSITIPNSVTNIGKSAFSHCNGLTSITIPESVTSIKDYAFSYCSGLTSITIPNSVTSIGESAFSHCNGLTSITIPNSVTSIREFAFMNCNGLTSVTSYIPAEKLFAIDSNVFCYVDKNNCTLYVPVGAKATYATTDGWKEFSNIVEFDPTGIEDVTEDVPAFEVTAGGIQLTAAEGKAVAVYTASGAVVEKIDSYAGEEIALDKSVYILRVGNKAVKIKL